jgi:hypothetical protein
MKSNIDSKKKNTIAVIAIIVLCVIPVMIRGALQSARILPTSVPDATHTPYIAPMFLTLTAQPTNTPFPTWTPEPTSEPQKLAWTACVHFIDDQLKLSSLDAQKYNPGGVIEAGDDYLVDVYYAVNDVTYTCLLAHDPNGDWRLLDLSKK